MDETHRVVVHKIGARFSHLSEVQAVAVAGSQTSGVVNAGSDIDVYIYTHKEIGAETRMVVAGEFADDAELNDYWGPGNEWTDRESGIHVDAMFWTVGWIEDQLDRVLKRHEAGMGYSTCFWHTIRVSEVVFDRTGWFWELQAGAMVAYPEPLAQAIINHNFPILGRIASSYQAQLQKAAARGDRVSLNHRTAALLASYFDILFALNRVPHPGEKRLVELAQRLCSKRPTGMAEQVNGLIAASGGTGVEIGAAAQALIEPLAALLHEEGMVG